MDPGAGTSVQCLSLGMLFFSGMVVSRSFVVSEWLSSWWEYGTKSKVLMGAMILRDGLSACGVGTAAVGQRGVSGRSQSPRTHGCLRGALRMGL
jgi:hypothetical protein